MAPEPEGWLYKDPRIAGGAPQGYFSDDQVLVEVNEGRLGEQAFVWHAKRTKGDWLAAAKFKVFNDRFVVGRSYLAQQKAARDARMAADKAAAERLLRERADELEHAEGTFKEKAPSAVVTTVKNPTPWEIVGEMSRLGFPWIAIFLGVIGFSGGAFANTGSPKFLLAYAGIASIGLGVTLLCRRNWSVRWAGNVGTAITIVVLIWFARSDTYETAWSSEDAEYYDRYSRWGQMHMHRSYRVYRPVFESDEKGNRVSSRETVMRANGPMIGKIGDAKPHGEWSFYLYSDDIPILERGSTKYYWYGEEITEGEWHLRNK